MRPLICNTPRTLISAASQFGDYRLVSRAKVIENQIQSWSDSDETGLHTTEFPALRDLSPIGSPRADDHEFLELPYMPEDPYVEAALQAPPSPDYVPGPDVAQSRHQNTALQLWFQVDSRSGGVATQLLLHIPVLLLLKHYFTAPSAEETEPFETDDLAVTTTTHPAYRRQLGLLF
ncbi:hypothetical protein Tco_0241156 [Tanacetum coccineum]